MPKAVPVPHACLAAAAAWWLAAAAAAGAAMVQGDTLWHVRAGEWILAHKAIPKADPFSWTAPGAPWHAHEWLWEALAALLWGALGKWGVWLLLAAGTLAAGLSSFLLAAGRSGSPAWALACAVAVAPGLSVFLSARPHVFALGLFALWLLLLDAARGSRRAALSAPFLAALWANAHASAPLGIPAGAALLALDRIAGRPPARRQIFALAAGAAAVNLNPWGAGIWGYAAAVSRHPEMVNKISEWLSPDFHDPRLWPALALAAGLAALWPRADRSLRWLALGAFLAGLVSGRHLAYFFVLWPAAAAPALAARFGEPGERAARAAAAALAAAGLAAAAAFLPPAWLERPQEPLPFPEGAVAFMKERGLTERVFNHYTWGGYLIWEGIRPFVDGRADMYVLSGSGAMEDYDRALGLRRPPDPDGVLARRGVEVVLAPEGSWLALHLSRRSGWEKAYSDGTAAVFIKVSGKEANGGG